jgi:WD40 repeat protein
MFALEFSPNGRTLAGGGRVLGPKRGILYVWTRQRQLVDRLGTRRPVNDLSFTPEGSLLVAPTGYADGGDVLLWDPAAHRVARTIHADDSAVWNIDVSNDGSTLVTAGQSSGVRLWDVASGDPIGPSLSGLKGSVDTVDINPGGRTVVGADTEGNVLLWDVATGQIVGDAFPGPLPGESLAASFMPAGQKVIVVSETGSGWVWDVDARHWKARACDVAGRSLTAREWQELLPDRPYHATCAP